MSPLFEQLRSVESECRAVRWSITRARENVARTPTLLHRSDVQPSDLRDASQNIDRTYAVRLFAEFEAVLRKYWSVARRRQRRTPAEVLIDRVATLCNIPLDTRRDVHGVREYRNDLLHTGTPGVIYTLEEARQKLGRFLSFLPHTFLYPGHRHS